MRWNSASGIWTPGMPPSNTYLYNAPSDYWPVNAITGQGDIISQPVPGPHTYLLDVYPTTITFRKWISPKVHSAAYGDTNQTNDWNYVGDASSFIPSNPSFIGGNMVFHCFEDPAQFVARTGFKIT